MTNRHSALLLAASLSLLATSLMDACQCGPRPGPGDDGGSGGGGGSSGSGGGGGAATDGGTAGGGSGGGQGVEDGGADAGRTYDCHAFAVPSGWSIDAGFRGVVVATADAGLNEPVALTFAQRDYSGLLYVVNQGSDTVVAIDLATGATRRSFQDGGPAPVLLTTIAWDERGVFDGALYVGDQGSDSDGDSRLYRLSPEGALTSVVAGPAPGFDDIFGLAFTPAVPGWPTGLLVTGDTDSSSAPQWGLMSADGGVAAFSSALAGVEGVAVDPLARYGASVLASRPAGGGYSGDDSITRVLPDGGSGGAIASRLPGVHAITVAPPGPFGGLAWAASWSSQSIFAVELDGGVTGIASGLQLTNYDGNILAFSPDGRVLMVADRLANRIVCIEPAP